LPGGVLDGTKEPKKCFVIRGAGEMENHFECLWELFRSIELRNRLVGKPAR
jgi:myosin-crossreactive antigen